MDRLRQPLPGVPMRRERAIWLSVALAIVALAGINVALADQVRLTRLRCERTNPDLITCDTLERTGIGPFAKDSTRDLTLERGDTVTLERTAGRRGEFSTLAIARPNGRTRTVAT